MDRFLTEVNWLHDFRAKIRELDRADHEALSAYLHDKEGIDGDLHREWALEARDAQIPPRDLDWCWLFLGGRGTGKSHSMSAAVHTAIRAGLRRIHLVGPTASDLYDVNLHGPSGIMATAGRDPLPSWIPSKKRLVWPSGATAVMFSGEEPESLRGPQCEMVIIDEIARMRYAKEVWDNAMLGLRLGDKPRVLVATTPRPTPFMKNLIRMRKIAITTGSTYDNAQHLSPEFLKKIRELYEGTRLGRQELNGAMILDPVNALFKDDWIHRDELADDKIEQVSIGVDPSGGADEIGIVVGALLTDGKLGVLADRTIQASPARWGEEVVKAYDEFDADDCCVEINFGGAMATEVIRRAAERRAGAGERSTSYIRIKEVNASRGKVMRAEPISLLYEKGRVLHRPGLDALEAEMMSFSREWDRQVDGSPNRLDAAVWVLTRLSKIITDLPMA